MKLDKFIVLDYESYYSRGDFTLTRMSVPEYILDPRFKVHLLAAYDLEWPAPRIIEAQDIPEFFRWYPPEQTICVSHNMLFDGAISAWKYGWVPARMMDTLGMARALRTFPKYSLGAVAKHLFGHDPKGDVIHKVSGLDVQGIKNAGLWGEYCTYAMNDVRTCAHIYFKLAKEFPVEEAQIMDLVLRCAIQPVLHADVELLQTHLEELRRRKAQLLNEAGFDRAALMSTAKFQEVLEFFGVEVATKTSPTGNTIPAFAKTDPFMNELLEYDKSDDEDVNFQVQALAAARLSQKSTIEETRAQRFLNVAKLPWRNGAVLPVPLRYGAAHTHRLGGEWGMNLQNLPRDKAKSKLRQALKAPPGCKLIAADLSQIEARIVATTCGQKALTQAFAKGIDVYAEFASVVFGHTVNKQDHPAARHIGKTAVLGLGYGCGRDRFHQMVVTSARQANIDLDPKNFDIHFAEFTVNTYRNLFPNISNTWREFDQLLISVINNDNRNQQVTWGPVIFKSRAIVLPNKMTLRYKKNDENIYGAKILENVTQALARIVIMQAALRLAKRGLRFVLQSHDELVFVVSEEMVEEAKTVIMEELLKPPAWLPELPLAAEIGVGMNYAETK